MTLPKKTFHRIYNSINVGTILKNKQLISLNVATETSKWIRTEKKAREIGPHFKDIVEANSDAIPDKTKKLTMR
jgi:hypothetical protein